MPYDLIIFDCDGVLVDSEVLAIQGMREVLTEAGIPATAEMIGACFGMKQADILFKISEWTQKPIPDDLPPLIWPATRRLFESELRAMPGVRDFLQRSGTIPRCVASSSSPERIRLSLGLTALDGFFGPHVFSSHQVARGKPAPDLFLFAAAAMGVEPERAVVIEDSIYGVQGARAAGMTVFGYTGGSHIPVDHDIVLREGGVVSVETDWAALADRILD